MRERTILAPLAGLATALTACPSWAQPVPSGFTATTLAANLDGGATGLAVASDGRVYITQQGGDVRVWDPATGLQASPFYTFQVEVSGERGLIGIALDPGFAANHFVYVHFSKPGGNGPIIKRVTASASNPNIVVAGSETTLVDLGSYPTTNNWHVGGGLRFGGDGKLYVGLGENGNSANSQTIANLFGKLLRVNPNPASPIPTDNPTSFAGIAGSPTGNNRLIYAVGLRNPFTFAFHPTTGRLFINDVGQNAWEEIDEGFGGANYGWPTTEGDFTQSSFPNFTRPFYAYDHGTGQCIIGGAFYHPPEHTFPPDYFEDYFFADYVAGWIKRIDVGTHAVTDFTDANKAITGVAIDPQGRLLMVCDGAPGSLVRVEYTASLAPSILTQPVSQNVGAGGTAQFSVYAAGNHQLTYQWRRNGTPLTNGGAVSGANTPTLTITGVDCSWAGTYQVVVTNSAGSATSAAATLNGASSCYANCDCSATAPILNVADFTCFLQRYANNDPYANCDQSTTNPTLNVADFTCYLQKYALGCT